MKRLPLGDVGAAKSYRRPEEGPQRDSIGVGEGGQGRQRGAAQHPPRRDGAGPPGTASPQRQRERADNPPPVQVRPEGKEAGHPREQAGPSSRRAVEQRDETAEQNRREQLWPERHQEVARAEYGRNQQCGCGGSADAGADQRPPDEDRNTDGQAYLERDKAGTAAGAIGRGHQQLGKPLVVDPGLVAREGVWIGGGKRTAGDHVEAKANVAPEVRVRARPGHGNGDDDHRREQEQDVRRVIPSQHPAAYRAGAKYPLRLVMRTPGLRGRISTARHFPSRRELVEV